MRLKIILFIFISMWLMLIVRIFYLSVSSNSHYKQLSLNNTIKIEKIAPVRGEIVDRNGVPIAINKLGFKIKLKPHLLTKKNKALFDEEVDNLLFLFPNLKKERIIKRYKRKDSFYNHKYIEIIPFISYKEMMPVYSMLNLRKNIKISPAPKRFYPYQDTSAHIIGYVARANKKDIVKNPLAELIGYTGKIGLEKYYNSYLQGEAGYKKVQVNASNQIIKEISFEKPNENKKLILNMDIKLQKYIDSLFKDKSGVVVVMNVDGSILAASSYPTYDLNIFVNGMSYSMYNKLANSLEHPFTNKLINGLYPPGSTVKIGFGLLYITMKSVGEKWGVYCTSSLPFGGRVFRCWKKQGHHKTNIIKAIRESCDDYFYKGSILIGNKKMSDAMLRYGLGKKTGIDLPNEFIGVVPSREWKRRKYNRSWNPGETLNTSIGQGDFLVTPIQIAQLTALIATGKLPTPHFVKKFDYKTYEITYKDVLTKQEKKKLPIIRKAMYQVCHHKHGTATHFLNSKIDIAGKTGTAQVIGIKQDIEERTLEHDLEYYKRSHAWFTTYGPYKNPQYVVLVMVEHGGHGGHAGGAIVSKIYNKLLELGYIKR